MFIKVDTKGRKEERMETVCSVSIDGKYHEKWFYKYCLILFHDTKHVRAAIPSLQAHDSDYFFFMCKREEVRSFYT